MKAVKNGKLYDTEAATPIAEYWNGYDSGNFKYVEENLYKTRRGKFFLAAKGGALSAYAEECGNMKCAGSALIPMSDDDALAWCERNAVKADIISEHFRLEEA